MPFLNDDNKPSFLSRDSHLGEPPFKIPPNDHSNLKNTLDNTVNKESIEQQSPNVKNPLDKPYLFRSKIYREFLNNPDVRKQALLEGKKPWDLAKELTEKFSYELYGSTIEKYEVEKQLYLDNLKMKHQQEQESSSPEKFKELKQERQEHSLLEKLFGVKKSHK
jgi:hypothetical protein